jgi:hypothetical protein
VRIDGVDERLAFPGRIFRLQRRTSRGRRLGLTGDTKRNQARSTHCNMAGTPGKSGSIKEIARVLKDIL